MSFYPAELSAQDLSTLKQQSLKAKGAILTMTTLAASGHPGGSMSSIDLLLTLYKIAKVDAKNPLWNERDRIVVSHGHISPAVYSCLGLNSFFDLEKAISEFRLAGSIFEGHIEPDVPGVEWGTGNLGQGLSAGCGFALACRQKNVDNHIYVLMGDGEQQKGQLSEARRFAVKFNLPITAIVDYNRLQISGDISGVMPQNIAQNYISDGWKCIEINGHNFEEIHKALVTAKNSKTPTLILANTVMGNGVSFMENKAGYHGAALKPKQLDEALTELKLENKLEEYKKTRSEFVESKKSHKTYNIEVNQGKPIVYTEKTDNRSAWGNAIADVAKNNDISKLAVFDCDLAGSVKTDGFAKVAEKSFYQAGIMEHHVATMAGVMSYEGIQVFWADFGVFGIDETFNQHRLTDINNGNVKIVTTHVGLDVGEDGKTHQCIDYLGLMKNLFGFNVLLGADPNQTDRIVRYVAATSGNFLLPMGRSKMDMIKKADGSVFFDENYKYELGKADILREGNDASILVMGAMATVACEVADELKKENINIKVVNISSPTCLDEKALKQAAETKTIFTLEDHSVKTGLGNSVADKLFEMQCFCRLKKFGVEAYACSGNANSVYAKSQLDAKSIINRIKAYL